MKGHWIKLTLFAVILIAAVVASFLLKDRYFSVEQLKEHRAQLLTFITAHYIQAVLCFIALYIGTAFFLPGALVLTIAGGMMFGAFPTVLYVNIGATTGAVLAFVTARSFVGGWVQERFKEQLTRFNAELSRHGHNYLLTLRLIPIAPFFVINYCAGLTRIPIRTFIWTTSLGMIPGSLIYAFIGEQVRFLNAPADLFSWKILLALLGLALFALLPVILHHLTAPDK